MSKSSGIIVLGILIILGAMFSNSQASNKVTRSPAATESPATVPEPVKQTVNAAKLVSDVRTTYSTLTERISNELEDLGALKETTIEKLDKMAWMSKDARFDEEQRVKELRDSGLKQIADLKDAVASLDSQIGAQIASAKLASVGLPEMAELDQEAARISTFVESTSKQIQEISDFFGSMEL
ncbi:hypothetical protein [Sphaerochaeta sp.]|uniref:hypothetical protein n=1 Tax=Sphaerochaeta sp. TaxID=1972642 RepID=UPI00258563AE|nr:hypothetical protein [Sphaerochaeta sp.]MDD3456850.1 hypothetical protein [Sphaerochaeta sp.]